MSRPPIHAVALGMVLLVWPTCLSGQRTAGPLSDALNHLQAGRLDSAITLLQAITNSQHADSAERAEAFLWLGVATFYKGGDSAATDAFRSALRLNSLLTPAATLARLDSGLAALWETEPTRVLCGEALPAWISLSSSSSSGDPLNGAGRAGEGPEIVSGPPISYPAQLRRAGIQGRVVVRVIIDTVGRAERGSVRIVWTAHPGFSRSVTRYMERARFRAAASTTGRERACVVFPVDFRIKR